MRRRIEITIPEQRRAVEYEVKAARVDGMPGHLLQMAIHLEDQEAVRTLMQTADFVIVSAEEVKE